MYYTAISRSKNDKTAMEIKKTLINKVKDNFSHLFRLYKNSNQSHYS